MIEEKIKLLYGKIMNIQVSAELEIAKILNEIETLKTKQNEKQQED